MKKLLIPLLAAAAMLLLCSCSGVVISIDGVPNDSQQCAFGLVYDGSQGNVYSESPEGYYPAGAQLMARAVPAEGCAFYCWTMGGTLEDGGYPVSYDKDYPFTIVEDTWLYANFRTRGSALVLYYANGGTALLSQDGEGENYWDEYSLAYYLYPNTLPDIGYFEREGHTLIGYNTAPDGSGEFYNVGGKAFEDTDEVIELWCVWSECSPVTDLDFTYDTNRRGYIVTGYHGAGGEVSIPRAYQGEPVVSIAAGAFTDCDTMTSLVCPSTLRVVQDYAVNNCSKLERVYLFDSLDYVADLSFDGDTALDTIFFGAATKPRYANWFNNHTKKIEIMNYWKDSDRPKMICLGGSSTTYALDAQQLESLLDRDYLVLNCGTNGANLFNMTSEWAMRFMNEGDFLLQITEYSAWQLGGTECRWESFRSFESCYNVFSWVPASQYTKFFDSFNDYLDARRDMAAMEYTDYIGGIAPEGYYDIQGTLKVVTRPNGSDSFHSGRNIYFCGDWLYPYMIYYLNVQYWKLGEMGCDYAMAFTPLNRNSLYDYQTDEAMEDFEAFLAENLNITIVSDLQENIYDPEVFFDDDYHLAAPARAEYTEQLANDLNGYLATLDEK